MKVTLTLDSGDLKSLRKMVEGDTDTADKQALRWLLWNMAEQAGLCDEDGNLITEQKNTYMIYGKDAQMRKFMPIDMSSGNFTKNKIFGSMYTVTAQEAEEIVAKLSVKNPDITFQMRRQA